MTTHHVDPNHAAARRLLTRFGDPEKLLTPGQLATNVAKAARLWRMVHAGSLVDELVTIPEPGGRDMVDALRQMRTWRAEVDEVEGVLILSARGAGITWEEIGEALGYPEGSRRQQAYHRAKSLGLDLAGLQ